MEKTPLSATEISQLFGVLSSSPIFDKAILVAYVLAGVVLGIAIIDLSVRSPFWLWKRDQSLLNGNHIQFNSILVRRFTIWLH